MEISKLISLAKKASENSYSKYSNFKVGAVVVTKNRKTFLGTNIENASFGATCCAERVALFNAVSSGERDIDLICIYSENTLPYPCGICRQVLSEFNLNMKVIVANKDSFKEFLLKDLLPNSFNLN